MSSAYPAVSVVVPVLNEERYLRALVEGILAQNYPGEIEVLLAIGPSRDRTAEIAAQLSRADPRVQVLDNPSGRTPDALNTAIGAARYDIIARVDGHAELSDNYLRTAVDVLTEVGADNVGGVADAQGVTAFERAVARAMRSKIGVGNASFRVGGQAGEAQTVWPGVFRRAALERVGGYDPGFLRAQDWEMNHRIRETGGRVWFTPLLRVTYRPRGTLRGLAGQYFQYGRWRRVVGRRHPGTTSLRYLAPPAMVVGVSLCTAAGVVWPVAFVVPAGYLVGVCVGGWAAGGGEPWSVRLRVPAALATMHWSWGIGFLTSPRSLARPSSGAATSAGASG